MKFQPVQPHPLTDWCIGIDGVEMYIPIHTMKIGDSLFVPCLNQLPVAMQVGTLFQKRGFKYTYRERIERGILGLRFWRVV